MVSLALKENPSRENAYKVAMKVLEDLYKEKKPNE